MLRLWHRFQRDVQANRPKAALMAGLLLLGCCFWIPMLAKVVSPKRAAAVTSTRTHPSSSASASIPNQIPVSDPETDQFWSTLEQALERDPLFQSADVGQLERDPFDLKNGDEPPAVVVVTEPPIVLPPADPPIILPPADTAQVTPQIPKMESQPKTLRLTSTIISRSRRAALINGQLVTLGRPLSVDGQSYLLTQVDSNRVVLSSGEDSFELKMARPQLKDVIDRRAAADPNE